MHKILFKIALFRNDVNANVSKFCRGEAHTELPYIPSSKMKIGNFTIGHVEVKDEFFEVTISGIEDPTLPEPLGRSLPGMPSQKFYPYNRYDNMEQMIQKVREEFIPGLNWEFYLTDMPQMPNGKAPTS